MSPAMIQSSLHIKRLSITRPPQWVNDKIERMPHFELTNTSLILGLCTANERRRYKVTTSLIGWAQAQNQPANITPVPAPWRSYVEMPIVSIWQATGLDAWTSRVKCPARFVSHLHEICIYIWVVYSLCFFCCLIITVTWWYVWCIEWASGNQDEVQACLVTLWLFIISCYRLYKITVGLLCSWFENNPHFHKYSMDFHV